MRQKMITIHVLLASFFLPFLFLLPLSGGLYLLNETGTQEKTAIFSFQDALPTEKLELEAFFRDQFKKNNIDFDFEYIRTSGSDFIFRPTSRIHYIATTSADGTTAVSKVDPSILKRIMEIHKGHGPSLIKWVEIAFGGALILVTLSGLWLALTVASYRKLMLIAFAVGSAAIVAALN
ncbi:MAG: hypothetical protein K2X47_00270 [Bdellovibrionales bacterium]|nr:hypothetical protein [Bdellovibrionales bacterium]